MKKDCYPSRGNIFMSLLFLLISIIAIGQNTTDAKELYADAAREEVPGAMMVKLNDLSPIPSLVMFQEGSEINQGQFFIWMKETFKIPSDYEFTVRKEAGDDLGATHIKYNISYRGVSLDLNWLTLHVRNNLVYQFNGNIQLIESTEVEPGLDENTALNSALSIVNAPEYLWQNEREEEMLKARKKDQDATYFPEGTLVIVNDESGVNLAWKFDIRSTNPGLDQQVFINASTGKIIKSYPLSYECDGGTVASTWYGTQNINTDVNGDGDYILLDDCGGAEIHTTQTDGSDFTASDNNWTSAGETGPGTTHLHGRISMDYLSAVHGRNSYDDAGGDLEIRYIAQSNAYWSGGGLMRIGNSNSSLDANHYNTIDVVAHEMFHGVTDFEANLVYQGEPGALNESFSDIFGETCEMWYENLPSNQWDWLHREDYFNGINRSLIDPNTMSDPDTYNGNFWANTCNACGDNGGVHTNSGVQNYWFYVLTVGATGTNDNGDDYDVSGIGLTKARTIAYDNLTAQLGVNSDFSDARTGAIAAAIARYGACSNEVKQVTNAWYAVGVGDPYAGAELVSKTDVTCNGDADGAININPLGTAPFTYTWSDGPAVTQDRSGLSGGVYTVTVTDATGCSGTLDITINEPDLLEVNIIGESDYNGFNVTCNGAMDGIAISKATGGTMPYSYSWDDPNNHTTASADDLGAGLYTVTVTDANGCMASINIVITEPPVLTANITSQSDYNGYGVSCNGGSDGWAEVTAGGGVPPYTYLWDDGNGQVTAKAENLSAGTYEVTVTDANNCTATDEVTLTEPDPLTIDAGPNQTVYYGYSPAECTDISWSDEGGGVPPYTISWSDNGAKSHQVCPGINTTVYTVTITDANGCMETDEVTICVIDVRCGKKLDKVEMCHVPEEDPLNVQTICVSHNSVAMHLAHGDMLAACGTDHTCYDLDKNQPVARYAEPALKLYPNPFNNRAYVEFVNGVEGKVSIELYNAVGQRTKVLFEGEAALGMEYKFEINSRDAAIGMNLVVVRYADGTSEIHKLLMNR